MASVAIRDHWTGQLDREPQQRCPPVIPAQCERVLLLSAYSAVIGVATEVEVLRALGIEPTARSLIRRRTELLGFLRSALVAD